MLFLISGAKVKLYFKIANLAAIIFKFIFFRFAIIKKGITFATINLVFTL